MKINMGIPDRAVRVLAAIAIAVLFFTGTISGTWGYVLLGVGFIFLLTGIAGSCPLYSLFGFSTCPVKKNPVK